MDEKYCCGDKNNSSCACQACGTAPLDIYWCETCQRRMPEKRCLLCGLKCRRTGPSAAEKSKRVCGDNPDEVLR